MFRKCTAPVYKLLEFNLSDLDINDEVLKMMADSPKMVNLTSLIIRKCLSVTDRGIEHISKSKFLI